MPKVAPAPAAQEAAAHAPQAGGAVRERRWAWSGSGAALTLGATFATIYIVLALVLPLPVIYQDEGFYQHLARSLAQGDGFTWRGAPVELRSALYVYLLAPVWLVADGVRAWEIAKVETVLLSCLVAVPVWLLARELLSRGPALLTVALSLTGTWMAGSGSLMTESIALPLATASLALAVQALRRPSARLPWLALLFALLAAWARIQLVVLVPVLFAALLLDLARSGRGWRDRARRHRAPLIAMAVVLTAGAAVLAIAGRGAIGGYASVAGFRPSAAAVARSSGLELLHLATLTGLLPLLLLGVLLARRTAWRDDVVGPLLAVLVPAVVVLAVQNGFYISGVADLWPIQRYMIYVAPLLLVFVVAAFSRERLVGRRALVGVAVLSVPLLAMPEVVERSEQRAAFATVQRVRDVLPQATAGVATLIVALVLCGLAAAAIGAARRGRVSAAPVVGLALLVVLVTQTATAMTWQLGVQQTARKALPDDLTWVDDHSRVPVSVLQLTGNSAEFALLDFFNARIGRVYTYNNASPGPMLQGGRCGWRVSPVGEAEFAPGCAPLSDRFFINDPTGRFRFYDERSATVEPKIGRLVSVRAPLRVKAVVSTPCSRALPVQEPVTLRVLTDASQPCQPSLTATTWLKRPGALRVTVRGAPFEDHAAVVGGRRHAIRAGALTEIRVPIGSGRADVSVDFDWAARGPLLPLVTRVVLDQDGARDSLL